VIAYLDTSVILRIVLKEPDELREWNEIRHGVTSELTVVECHRGLYRAHAHGRLDSGALHLARNYADQILRRLSVVNITPELLEKATGTIPGLLGALDAIHLVSAITFRDRQAVDEPPILLATHDRALARIAATTNFDVLGA
jgi:predicted nucleic acid-binding protein